MQPHSKMIWSTPLVLAILALAPGLVAAEENESPDDTPPQAQAETPEEATDTASSPETAKPAPAVDFAVRVEMPELEAEAAGNEALLREITALREDFRQLQETLELVVGRMMADVESENLALRNELRRLGTAVQEQGGRLPVIPGGNPDLLDEVMAQQESATTQETGLPAEDFTFEIVQEWGRSPEAAAALGDNVSTLKGMVGVVPPNAYRDDIEDLGRQLRAQFDAYDNINIEVFDSLEAAQNFAERQVSNPDNRVLSVSKHKDSGRDAILYIEGDKTFDVPQN